jgi:hypothetical protein
VTPLEELCRLLKKYGHSAEAVTMNSLAAREEARVEGERFWADLAGTDMFGEKGSIAAVTLAGEAAPETAELAWDRKAFRRALFLVAQELRLRAFESADSERWRLRLRAEANAR